MLEFEHLLHGRGEEFTFVITTFLGDKFTLSIPKCY